MSRRTNCSRLNTIHNQSDINERMADDARGLQKILSISSSSSSSWSIMTSLGYLNGLYQQNRKPREEQKEIFNRINTYEALELIGCWLKCLAYLIRRRSCRQNLTSLTLKNKLKRIRSFLWLIFHLTCQKSQRYNIRNI